jgi:predicted alpha/beta-fold hydrolase
LPQFGNLKKVDLPDGDRLFCYITPGISDTVVVLFHGLSGDVSSDYMQRTGLLCQKLGHTFVLVNHRGAGEGFMEARQPYHSGRAEDMSAVLASLRQEFPNKKQIAIGYSMSGNILLCLLGGFRGAHLPDAAIAVNSPIDLRQGSMLLKKGLNRIYDMNFVLTLRKQIAEKQRLGLSDKRYAISPLASIWDFDEIYTAPASGFKNRDDYYEQCSAIHYIPNIKTPTHVLTAADDPFVSVENSYRVKYPSSTQLHVEARGGHMGYLAAQSTPLGSNRWLDYYLHEALESLKDTLA